MGAVYEAEEFGTGRRVALKLISAEYAGSPEAVARFRQEGQLASKIAHPRCVFVQCVNEEAGRPYIVMELMPGTTLKDVVDQKGPLPLPQAVSQILDVIDGLKEAHRLGVIHRDVKPGNCFVEADGRVKIGDFGLAKSLADESHLTKVGSFLGTVLFASPEQIRKEPLDARADVYSVAATLYYLLTGEAPFQTGDTTATLARILMDPTPSLRALRPEVPAAMDQVVQRGLERDPGQRWQDLEDFRRALLPFVRGSLTAVGLGQRLTAFLLDVCLLYVVQRNLADLLNIGELYYPLIQASLGLTYFGVLEGKTGWSLGKWALGVRVTGPIESQPPGIMLAVRRAFWLFLFTNLGAFLTEHLYTALALRAVGFAAILAPMRARNGYRGLHELLSDTRVLFALRPDHRRLRRRTVQEEIADQSNLPEHVGAFAIRGFFPCAVGDTVLLGEDVTLGRQVWIWQRPVGEAPLAPASREISRATRPRWLAAGQQGDQQWDAFLAAPGCALPRLTAEHGPLTWAEFRPMLEELTQELAAAQAEGTLPASLTEAQVWVQPDGNVLLLDMPLGPKGEAIKGTDKNDPDCVLAFLQRVAFFALEDDEPQPPDGARGEVRAPLPLHASRLLARLGSGPDRYQTLEQFQVELAAMHALPAEITWNAKLWHLGGQCLAWGLGAGGFLLLVFAALFTFPGLQKSVRLFVPPLTPANSLIVVLGLATILWNTVTRGGLLLVHNRLTLVGQNGRRATRLQCAVRSICFWVPLCLLAGLANWVTAQHEGWTGLRWGLYAGTLVYLIVWLILSLLHPARSLSDRVARTYLVPR
jgi:hypothetical protein